MAKCRNCGRDISSFDKDICPYCGTLNPIEDNYQTKDVTSIIPKVEGEVKLKKQKSLLTYLLLGIFFGIFGVEYFYLKKWKEGLISIALTLLITGGLGSIFFFLVDPLKNAWGYLLPLLVCFLASFVYSLLTFLKGNVKDNENDEVI